MPTALAQEKVHSLMQAVAAGERPADVAKKLKVSKATVYKHMRTHRTNGNGEQPTPANELRAENVELRAENAELRRLLGDALVETKLKRPAANGHADTQH